MVGLGDLPDGPFHSEGRGVSADGSVVVGFSDSASGRDAFRWTAQEGMVNLGAGALTHSARDISADGSVIVGAGLDAIFIWDAAHGLRSLRDMLGLDLSDWEFISAQGISDDGSTIIGFGRHLDGTEEAWIAVLPEPSSVVLLTFGGLIAALRRPREC
jgi:probable HAF family extracellular repeat protein